MKNKFLKIGIAAMIVSAAAVNVYLNNSNKNEPVDVNLANVEALGTEFDDILGRGGGYRVCCVTKTGCYYTGNVWEFCVGVW